MGYQTYYRLTVWQEDGVTEVTDEKLYEEEVYDGIPLRDLCSGNAEDCKWYDHQGEMAALSKKYPRYIFDLTGDGEKQGDVWNEFYWYGHFYEWNLEYELPKVNVKKLKCSPLWKGDDSSLFKLEK